VVALALLLSLLSGSLALTPVARGATITVNTTSDDFETNANCSLREAIESANNNTAYDGCVSGTVGLDTITFAIGTGPVTITLNDDLPDITEAAFIDGTTQPGYAGTPLVELRGGGNNGDARDGLSIRAGGSTVRALTVTAFYRYGIHVTDPRRGTNTGVNTLSGNVIVGNDDAGIRIGGGDNNVVSGNVISGNGTVGIYLGTTGNFVWGNRIGTDLDGVTPRGNAGSGIRVDDGNNEISDSNNLIGGGGPGDGNIIANNGGAGIAVITPITGTRILGNSIYSNVGLGIDLEPSVAGPLPNDPQDGDMGANNGQNAPVLTAVPQDSGSRIIGSLNSTPATTFRLEFFSNPVGCPAAPAFGQGRTPIGTLSATTDANGNYAIDFPISPLMKGQAVTATATSNDGAPGGDTSEFSNCVQAEANDAPSFNRGPDQAAVGNTNPRTVPNWATNISPGPADEAGQALTFIVTNDNPGLFAAQPAISPDGTLTYTPASGANGSAVATVRLQDNGGTANGGVDISAPQTFNLIVITGTTGPSNSYTVVATTSGNGTVSPAGTTNYPAGSEATYTATPGANQIFLGWTLNGTYVSYANPLTFTVDGDRALVATFAARPNFTDVPTSDQDYQAITFLAALGIVNPNGVNGSGQFQPNANVKRAEVAAFIARTFGWDDEFHRNTFPDKCDPQGQNCVDDELWNNVAALADYGVVGGYTDEATCESAGTTAPCYLPRDNVSRVQVVSIVARAFTKTPDLRPTGFWDRVAAPAGQYTNVADSGTQRSDLATYRANAGAIPGQANDGTFPDPNGAASRRFIIQVLYQAFSAEFSADNIP
jgi:CSLREA domain-containing protein